MLWWVGYEVVEVDIDFVFIEILCVNDGVVVFFMLYGGFGENGVFFEVF